METRVVAMLPCADTAPISELFEALGFAVTYRQERPNQYVALEGYGVPLHYYGLDGHRPEDSHSTCGIVVKDPQALFDVFAERLRAAYGRLPTSGFPRITRPRPRKNADGHTGFTLIDPAGNWIRVFRDPESGGGAETTAPSSPLGEALLNAIVIGDSKGDTAQAVKILRGAIGRAPESDPALAEATEYLAELTEREQLD